MKNRPTGFLMKNGLLLMLVLAFMVTPLIVRPDGEFRGTDGAAVELVGEVEKGYQPWFESVWKPPGGEVESLLFSLQAALGSGFIGYYFGYQRGRKKPWGKQKKCYK